MFEAWVALAVATVVALLFVALGVEAARLAFRLRRRGETTVADLSPGRTATVGGRARTDAPLTAPLSGEPCIAYRLTEWTVPTGSDSLLRPDLPGGNWWERRDASERTVAVAVPFTLADGSDEVRVVPGGATALTRRADGGHDHPGAVALSPDFGLDLSRDRPETVREGEDEPVPSTLDPVVAVSRLGGEAAGRLGVRRWRYREERVPVGADLWVTGTADDGTLRDDGPPSDSGSFVLSDTPLGPTVRRHAGSAVAFLAVGLLALGAAASLLPDAL